MRLGFWVVAGLILCGVLPLAFMYGGNIPFKQQWSLYEALRTTASIILAIMAAWVAIIYPDRLKFFKGHSGEGGKKEDTNRFAVFLHPIINSLVILSIVLLVGILAPIVSQFQLVQEYSYVAKQISYTLLVSLTMWQIYTVVTVFIPVHLVKQENDMSNNRKRKMEYLESRNPKKPI